eukprot:3148464-Pleurochrysis_carterae.AAC.2
MLSRVKGARRDGSPFDLKSRIPYSKTQGTENVRHEPEHCEKGERKRTRSHAENENMPRVYSEYVRYVRSLGICSKERSE